MCAVPKPVEKSSGFFYNPFKREFIPSMHTWVATNRRLLIVHEKRENKSYVFRTLSINYREITGVKLVKGGQAGAGLYSSG